jgi:hypothetical protein
MSGKEMDRNIRSDFYSENCIITLTNPVATIYSAKPGYTYRYIVDKRLFCKLCKSLYWTMTLSKFALYPFKMA